MISVWDALPPGLRITSTLCVELDWLPVYLPSLLPIDRELRGGLLRYIPCPARYAWEDHGVGIKLDGESPQMDFSLSYYNGLHSIPGLMLELAPRGQMRLHQTPYRVHVVGGDFSSVLGYYGLRGEGAWLIPIDTGDATATIPSPQLECILGVDRGWEHFSLIVQYMGKFVYHLVDAPQTVLEGRLRAKNRMLHDQYSQWSHTISLRPALSLLHETLGIEVLGLWHISQCAYFCQPKLHYDIYDGLRLTLGAQLFYGPSTHLFGMLESQRNSGFVELKMSF